MSEYILVQDVEINPGDRTFSLIKNEGMISKLLRFDKRFLYFYKKPKEKDLSNINFLITTGPPCINNFNYYKLRHTKCWVPIINKYLGVVPLEIIDKLEFDSDDDAKLWFEVQYK